MKLIIAEKPSVAKSIASALGVKSGADGSFQGNGYIVSWCVGHLVSPMDAAGYNDNFKKWRYDDLPILPEPFRYVIAPGKEAAFENLRTLMNRPDVDTVVNACDAGREGELIFRLVYEMTGCNKPIQRLWISSMEDSAIREGMSDLRPGAEYDALYQSALCRQKADWLVGINATRLFSVLYHRTLNVVRVQTPPLVMLAVGEPKTMMFRKEKYHHVRLKVNGVEAVSEKIVSRRMPRMSKPLAPTDPPCAFLLSVNRRKNSLPSCTTSPPCRERPTAFSGTRQSRPLITRKAFMKRSCLPIPVPTVAISPPTWRRLLPV